MKKRLLIIIDALKRGGAEVLLIGILKELNDQFDVILVTLTDECQFKETEIPRVQRHVLSSTRKLSFISCLLNLRKLINKKQPEIIHAHLFYSSLLARLTCPSSTPLFYSIHNEVSKNIFQKRKVLKLVERLTIRRNHTLVAVSRSILSDYENVIKNMPNAVILPNYIREEYFQSVKTDFCIGEKTRLVAVGNIRPQKNYQYLIDVFKKFNPKNIEIDIYGYGEGKDVKELNDQIEQHNLPLSLKGSNSHLFTELKNYDLFISCSKTEGFGIAPVEAMAVGLPLLLSDLPVYHEVTDGNALFFNIASLSSLIELLNKINCRELDFKKLSASGIEIAKKYSKQSYLLRLFDIYNTIGQSQ